MNIPKINNTNFKSIYVDHNYTYSWDQEETIRRLRINLKADYEIDSRGKNLYDRLSEKGYDVLIKGGKNSKEVNVTVAKCIITQFGVEDMSDVLEVGNFTKDNASRVVDKIKEKKNKKHLTLKPIYIALAAILSVFGIAKCTQNQQVSSKSNLNITDTIKSGNIKKDMPATLKLNALLKSAKSL